MRLLSCHIENYKSLRAVTFRPGHLACLVGVNGAGKSNLADALDFLANVYRHGLEGAVAIKGGYENIAFRRLRRSKSPIRFSVNLAPSGTAELRQLAIQLRTYRTAPQGTKRQTPIARDLSLTHRFSFQARGTGIKAEFYVTEEEFVVSTGSGDSEEYLGKVRRDESGSLRWDEGLDDVFGSRFRRQIEMFEEFGQGTDLPPQELLVASRIFPAPFFRWVSNMIAAMSVYKLSPELSRHSGVPTPNPVLTYSGENLPAMVDWLQRQHPKLWRSVFSAMQDIVPSLEDIEVRYLHTKTLGLFFKERNVGRHWSVEDVSDGTIQSLAMFIASVDPRTSLLVVEEPENSVHPWILKSLLGRLRVLSAMKTVIVTTHSPVLVDLLRPGELWIVYKAAGETHLTPLSELDPSLEDAWEEGDIRLSRYLDSGAISEAVPGGVF